MAPFLPKLSVRLEFRPYDIYFNSLHIKNSSHGIRVHSSVTKMQQNAIIFAIKRRGKIFCSRLGHSEFEASKLKDNIKYQKTKTLFK